MRTSMKSFCAAVCGVVMLAGLAGGCDDDKGGAGGGGAPPPPKLSSPKDAASSFVNAMQAGDVAGVKATTVNGTDADHAALASMGKVFKAAQALKAEATAKFGAE